MKSMLLILFATIGLSSSVAINDHKSLHQIKYKSETRFNHSSYADEINEAVQPLCTYFDDSFEESIACSDLTLENITTIFARLSSVLPDDLKTFQRLQLGASHNAIELNDDVLGGILFEEVFISIGNQGYVNFTVDRSLNIYNTTKLMYIAYLTSYSADFNEDYEDVLKHFTNLRSLSIIKSVVYTMTLSVNLTKDLFDNFPYLNELDISTGTILGIEAYTFWNTNMTYITFMNIADYGTKPTPEHAFAHKNPSNDTLTILFNYGNPEFLPIDAFFQTDSLVGINRPTRLLLSGHIDQNYLPESTFKPYLLENDENLVGFYIPYYGLDCTSCRNYWVQQYNLTSRIDEECENGNLLSDESNWSTCHGM